MYHIGIECHNLENRRWGIGRHLSKILETIARQTDPQPLHAEAGLLNEFKFYLYFKERIPDDHYLNHPIFVKRILKPFWLPRPSFNIFFHLLLPWAYRQDRLQAMFFTSFMLPAFFFGQSLVVLTNDIYYEYTEGSLPWRYKLGYRLFSNWAAKRATLLTTYTHAAKQELVRLFKIKPEKIVVNYLGIDRQQLRPANQFSKKNYLLYVGQCFPRRRAKETIEAFAMMAPQFPDLKLILIGQDKYRPPILDALVKKTNAELGQERIIHYAYVESDTDLLRLYQEAQLLIYLSSSEAMGLPPLEALAAGTPALVKDNPLNREIYEGFAFYSPSETDPPIIANTIANALHDQSCQQEILNHADQIISKFDWGKHVQNLLDQFKSIVSLP